MPSPDMCYLSLKPTVLHSIEMGSSQAGRLVDHSSPGLSVGGEKRKGGVSRNDREDADLSPGDVRLVPTRVLRFQDGRACGRDTE